VCGAGIAIKIYPQTPSFDKEGEKQGKIGHAKNSPLKYFRSDIGEIGDGGNIVADNWIVDKGFGN